jgi:putative ABC transport system permease protein
VAGAIRARLGSTATVTDIAETRSRIGSSLTAVDLSALTRVELGFAFALAVAACRLVHALGLAERRVPWPSPRRWARPPRQSRALVLGETGVVAVGGVVLGGVGGWALSLMLVAVLTGVFDPPPTAPTAPWGYLGLHVALAVAALLAAGLATARLARRDVVAAVRGL